MQMYCILVTIIASHFDQTAFSGLSRVQQWLFYDNRPLLTFHNVSWKQDIE